MSRKINVSLGKIKLLIYKLNDDIYITVLSLVFTRT